MYDPVEGGESPVPSLESILTPGSCDPASLVALLVGATAGAILLVRLPGGTILTFLPALLLPTWVLCGSLAAGDAALGASLIAGGIRTHRSTPTFVGAGVTLSGVIIGATIGALVAAAIPHSADMPVRELVVGAAFLGGYWLAEMAALQLATHSRFAPATASMPRSNIVVNLLLLFPGFVLTNLLLARGPAYFVPFLLVFVLALGLIALYVGATTAREAIVLERARIVAAAGGQMAIPPDVLEERAMELTHELRSPLTAILGYAGLLAREGGLEDRAREESYVASITSSSNYMLRLVNNILDLQRLEADNQPLQLRPVELEQFLCEVLEGVEPLAEEKGVRTRLNLEPGLPPLVTNELLLRRSVDNLLSNAVKYTRPGDAIQLAAAREGTGITIAVADTGIGLTREERDRLFERFFRGRRSETRVQRGTGLGLAIVREVVRKLNGEVRVESELGKGSTFTLWLPLRETEDPAEPASSASND
jgi:signal transduction histidine kinase